jgi:hypothetical protein
LLENLHAVLTQPPGSILVDLRKLVSVVWHTPPGRAGLVKQLAEVKPPLRQLDWALFSGPFEPLYGIRKGFFL